MKNKIHRQGDVLLTLVANKTTVRILENDLEKAVVGKPHRLPHMGSGVLAEGEATGHAHRLAGDFQHMLTSDGSFVRIGDAGATLTHEEHGTMTKLLPGEWYTSGIQREFADERVRNVVD
jgi:hypothetical protein